MEPPVSRYPALSDGQSRKYPFGRQSALAALNVRLIVDSKPMAENPKKKAAKPKREAPGVMGSLSAQRPARITTGRSAARQQRVACVGECSGPARRDIHGGQFDEAPISVDDTAGCSNVHV